MKVLKLKCDARAPDRATPDISRCAGFALLVANSTPSRKLLPKLAGFAAFRKQQVHDTAASRAKDLMCLEDRSQSGFRYTCAREYQNPSRAATRRQTRLHKA